jgi:hypothetical protein
MTTISELKAEGIGGPLQVRILHKWKHDIRQYETWYLDVDKYISSHENISSQKQVSNFNYPSDETCTNYIFSY